MRTLAQANKKKRVIMKAAILSAFVTTLLLLGSAHAQDKVSVQLDWVVRGNHAMFFVAKEKGYFAKQAIDITAIRRGTGSPNAMRLVGNGDADFGFGDLPTLALARYFLPPSPSALLPRPSPLVRGFFVPHHRMSRFRRLPRSATAPTRYCHSALNSPPAQAR